MGNRQLELIAKHYTLANLRPAFSEDITRKWFSDLPDIDKSLLDEYFLTLSSVNCELKNNILK